MKKQILKASLVAITLICLLYPLNNNSLVACNTDAATCSRIKENPVIKIGVDAAADLEIPFDKFMNPYTYL